ncbi:MAG: C2 family cysteine protease [Fimbriiglobus sp.]
MPRPVFALLLVAGFAAQSPGQSAFADAVAADFSRWDADRNGVLSAAELDAAVLNPRTAGDAAAAVATIKMLSGMRGKESLLPSTSANLRGLAGRTPGDRQEPDAIFAYALARIATKDTSLFGTGRPRLDAVKQGAVGNCFALAAVGALVNRDALAVTRMFETRPAGEYRVTFPAGMVITVAPFTDAELVLTGLSGGDGRWVNVLEKAVAEAMNRVAAGKAKAVALDATRAGGNPGDVLTLLTGHVTNAVWFRPLGPNEKPKPPAAAAAEARAALAAVRDGKLATASTPQTVTTPGVQPHHAFAVLGFDPARDEVKLWDPHGDTFRPAGRPGPAPGYPMAAGVMTVPVPEFVSIFEGVMVETAESARSKK